MDQTLFSKIWPVFVEEAREHLQEIGAGVLAMEKGPAERPQGLLEAIRRTAHSLKGSSASLGLHDLEKLAHGMEGALAGRAADSIVEPTTVESLLAAVDAAEAALASGDSGGNAEVPNLAELLARLTGAAPEPAPSPAPSAMELVWPMFRSEAGEHLARIAESLASWSGAEGARKASGAGDAARLAGSIKASASVLGIAPLEKAAAALEEGLRAVEREGEVAAARLEELVRGAARISEALDGATPDLSAAEAAAPAAREAAPAPVRPSGQGLEATFRQEAAEAIATMESVVARLVSPFVEDRAAQVEAAAHAAHNLKGSAGALGAGEVAELAARIEEAVSKMVEPGLEASRAAAAVAGLLVDLGAALSRRSPSAGETAARAERVPEPSAPDEAPKAAETAAAGPAIDRTIRVAVSTLESLSRQIEGMTLVRGREERRARDLRFQSAGAQELAARCERAAAEAKAQGQEDSAALLEEVGNRLRGTQRALARLAQETVREAEQLRLFGAVVRDDLRDLRMVPASTALEPLRRTVREVAGRTGKQIELTLRGGDVRLDRRILDELKDPLQHMVRNAIDHGVEAPEARSAAGKPAAGRLEIAVERRGHRAAVLVSDDGRGLDPDKLRAAAVRAGALTEKAAAKLSDQEALKLAFRSGLSTAEKVTAISGRGVGLDVVQETLTRLGGGVEVESVLGQGTQFTLDLPQTLAATLGVVVRLGGELAVIPYESVRRILRVTEKELGTVAGRAMVKVGEAQLPFASLAQVLGLGRSRSKVDGKGAQAAFLLDAAGHQVVLAVDEVVGQQELVIHPLGRHLARAVHLAGAAVLEDGRVVSVLNAFELAKMAQPVASARKAEDAKTRILVTDDSLTTRSAMKALLEIAGYQVIAAADGEEALGLLAESPCHLVVSDVQMPRMDGLTLTRRIKADARFAAIPVVLVTSLDAPSDRAAGLEAGADGYLVKRDVERGKLLELVRQLLPARA